MTAHPVSVNHFLTTFSASGLVSPNRSPNFSLHKLSKMEAWSCHSSRHNPPIHHRNSGPWISSDNVPKSCHPQGPSLVLYTLFSQHLSPFALQDLATLPLWVTQCSANPFLLAHSSPLSFLFTFQFYLSLCTFCFLSPALGRGSLAALRVIAYLCPPCILSSLSTMARFVCLFPQL